MFEAADQQRKLDLHGCLSVEEAKEQVIAFLEQALQNKWGYVTIVTGVGNHPISSGTHQKRGVFFKALPDWLNSSPYKPQLKCLLKNVGAYKVIFNSYPITHAFKRSLEHSSQKSFIFNISEHPLFAIILQNSPKEERLSKLKTALAQNPSLLQKTSHNGTTVLMVAAASNQVETMAWLLQEERKLDIVLTLLKQSRIDGTHALMFAVINGSIDAIDFLLKKAPSLLKKKSLDGASVFTISAQNDRARQSMELLYDHLKSHTRERGYTDLFREYKILKADHLKKIALDQPIHERTKIPVIDTFKFKQRRLKLRWFFIDRMHLFLRKLNHVRHPKLDLNRSLQDVLNLKNFTPTQIRTLWSILHDKQIRSAFLRFNHRQKDRFKRQWKGFVKYASLSKKQERFQRRKISKVVVKKSKPNIQVQKTTRISYQKIQQTSLRPHSYRMAVDKTVVAVPAPLIFSSQKPSENSSKMKKKKKSASAALAKQKNFVKDTTTTTISCRGNITTHKKMSQDFHSTSASSPISSNEMSTFKAKK